MVNGRFEWDDGMTKENLKNVLTAVRDMINRSSEIGIRKAQAAEEQAYKAQTAAETSKTNAEIAQTIANSAKATAETAQTTAETAQTTAETALPLAGGKMAGNIVTKEGVGIQADTVVPHRIILSRDVTKPDAAFEK